jgi:hypothetical protein
MFKLKFTYVKMIDHGKYVVLNIFVFKMLTARDRIEYYYIFKLCQLQFLLEWKQ